MSNQLSKIKNIVIKVALLVLVTMILVSNSLSATRVVRANSKSCSNSVSKKIKNVSAAKRCPTTPKPTSAATSPALTVLYDKLGSPGNWGFTGQGSYNSFFDSINQNDNFALSTQFFGNLSSNTILRRVEFAGVFTSPGQNHDMSLLVGCVLKLWNTNIADFHLSPTTGNISNTLLGAFNFGSTNNPVGSFVSGETTYFVYHVGWNDLNVNLPSNIPLELSIQCPVNSSADQEFGILGSSFSGTTFKSAIKVFGGPQFNFTISQPLAVKLSAESPTAASVSIGGRILTAEGRGISRATVILTDSNGSIRTARTNAFGYFNFDEVLAGGVYVVNVRHKIYNFSPQVITVKENISDLNFTAVE